MLKEEMNIFFLSLLQTTRRKSRTKQLCVNEIVPKVCISTKKGQFNLNRNLGDVDITFHFEVQDQRFFFSYHFESPILPETYRLLQSIFPLSGYKLNVLLRHIYLFDKYLYDFFPLGPFLVDKRCRNKTEKGCQHYIIHQDKKRFLISRRKVGRTLKNGNVVVPPHFSS
jgi:hypothetical protein